jgi:HD-GYP domain-containing protein (c-di-GMP phosphodiesterase class II)
MSEEDALTELRRCAGTQFDPRVVAAFEHVLRKRDAAEPAHLDGPAPAHA